MHSWVLSLFLVCFWAGKGDMVSASDLSNLLQKKSMSLSERYDLNASTEVKVGRSISVSKRGNAVIVDNTKLYHPSDSTITQSVEDMCVYAHNYVRALHGVGNLAWNSDLGTQAAAYAQHLADTGSLEHSSGDYGENLYMSASGIGAVSSVAHSVYSWYSESWRPNNSPVDKNYDYTFDPTDAQTFFDAKIGHFTAVVWKDTTEVGCGVASIVEDNWTKTYIVARYTSAGNLLGSFLSNVLPLTSGDASMNGQLDVLDLVEGITGCRDFVSSSTCSMYSSSSCNYIATDCACEC